jgi:hypothetical protein
VQMGRSRQGWVGQGGQWREDWREASEEVCGGLASLFEQASELRDIVFCQCSVSMVRCPACIGFVLVSRRPIIKAHIGGKCSGFMSFHFSITCISLSLSILVDRFTWLRRFPLTHSPARSPLFLSRWRTDMCANLLPYKYPTLYHRSHTLLFLPLSSPLQI